MKLRDYQCEQVHLLRKGYASSRRQILASPTGSGKTVVMSHIAANAAYKGKRIWVVTDRQELKRQTHSTFSEVMGGKFGIQTIDASGKGFYDAQVNVCMVETLNRRLASGDLFHLTAPDLILIDECHKRNFNKIIDKFPNAFVLGFSATPTGPHLHKYYQRIVQTVDIPDLIEGGWLCPYRAFQVQDDLSDVEVSGGEYKKGSLYQHYDRPALYKGVVDKYKEVAAGTKALVFNVNIDHAMKTTEAFNLAGITSYCVTSKTPDHERRTILRLFHEGHFPVLNNCGVLTTGYDEPSIETIIMNRATKSLPLFLQCLGRGSRPYPGKRYFTVIDHGLNHDEHGMWDERREWKLKPPRKKKDMPAPIKRCPKCDAINFASARICRNCGHQFPKKQKEEKEGEAVEVSGSDIGDLKGKKVGDLKLEELVKLEQAKRYKQGFIWRILRARGKEELERYAKMKGYKSGWIRQQLSGKFGTTYKNVVVR